MTGTRPPFQPKKLLWSSLFAVAIVAAGFLIMAVGKAFIAVAFATTIVWVFYVIALGNYRPKPSKWAGITAMVVGFATFFAAHVGSHSVWLSVFGETVHCKVISVDTVPSRTSPSKYHSKLQCGDQQRVHIADSYKSAPQPGTEMDVVVDRTGVVPDLEPREVGLGHNLLLLLALLMNGVFIFLVAWLPVREPE
ncbi:hypothetical protein ACFOWZ_07725 [Lentzea rhizosphaerae]|uniref:Uncharacterized protein n=1 Tax=Lentzea rhizosphaerae TaxID=2041025 RepID=A0ABV8BMF2_9PSEU